MKLKEVNKLKAISKTEYNNKEDLLYLKIEFNKPLIEVLKNAYIDEVINDEFYNGIEYINFERYKAKRIYFNSLVDYNKSKCFLYSKDLLYNGVVKIPFVNIGYLDKFIENFQIALRQLLELILSEKLEREITFNLDE